MSTECPVYQDLKQMHLDLKKDLARIRKDLTLCRACPDKCDEFKRLKADIEEAIRSALAELQAWQES
jgi:hypothetical protein